MAEVGRYNRLKVIKKVDFGVYLDGGDGEEILLPKRYVPKGLGEGDELEVFLYHDSENRVIATTERPKAIEGEIARMTVVSVTKQGAFMDWGLMKDLFVPLSQQEMRMQPEEEHLIMVYKDEQTGRLAGSARISRFLSNLDLAVKENDQVDLVVYQKTDIGYKVIINSKHLGVLHYNEVFRELGIGDNETGFVKTIREDNKIDVSLGERGYKKVEGEAEKILRLLEENDGYLPYHDKSGPEEIYEFFGMSKKTFKMTVGALYKQKQIELTKTGIKLLDKE